MGEESGEVESGGESAGDAVSGARGGADGIDQAEGWGVEGFWRLVSVSRPSQLKVGTPGGED